MTNSSHPVAFEEDLANAWGLNRTDVYESGIEPLGRIHAALPVRPYKALQLLKIDQAGLIELLKSGQLPRPAKLGHGRVAWRFDEIDRVTGYRL